MAHRTHPSLALLALTLAAACDGGTPSSSADMAAAGDPIDYYKGSQSSALGSSINQATCATCHSDDGTPRSGNTLKDIAFKTSFKGGDAKTLLAATNECVVGWMGGTALKETDTAFIKLKTYMESISDKTKTTPNTLAPEVLANQAAYEAAYGGGNAAAGADKYTKTCGVCHDRALIVNKSGAVSKAALKSYPIGFLAQKVRTAGPPKSGTMDATDLTPGPMPFFEPSDLSAQDLKDIIAHLKAP